MTSCPKCWLLALALATMLASTDPTAAQPATPRKPNILFILADDLGWADLGCYGSSIYQTPCLDRLASQGMRFTSAYAASSVCSPTRASILTGKYPARLDLTIWLGGRSPANAPLLDAPHVDHLPLQEVTIAEALRSAGYATASVGKWHLGGEPYYPQHQGFDLNVAGTHSGSPAGGYFLPNQMKLPGAHKGEYLTDRLTDEAIKFIAANRQRPFFLYLPYHAVHTPIQGKKDLIQKYENRMKETSQKFSSAYAAMVETLDTNVGRILKQLDDLGLTDNTLVIFFSDNGGYHRVTSNAPLRAGKGYSYEGGVREPLLVRMPGLTRAGSTSEHPVISTDFYATILELAGVPIPEKMGVDGQSLLPLLKDPKASLQRQALYWHYPHYSPQGGTPSGAIRVGPWKLIEFFEDGKRELYNLQDDLAETRDQASNMPEKVKELHKDLLTWRKQVQARMPSSNPGRKKPTPGPTIELTPSYPGLDVLHNVGITRSPLGLNIASPAAGLALVRPEKPLPEVVTFQLQIKPLQGKPSNGFLAFGSAPRDADLIKCGLLVGGNKISIFEGEYPSKDCDELSFPLEAGKTYALQVTVSLPDQKVTLKVAGREVTHKLRQKMTAISHYGYQVIRTATDFSSLQVETGRK